MCKTPFIAKVYLLLAIGILAIPTLGTTYYTGTTGKFLVSTEAVTDNIFRETVIYIIKHDALGAYGVIVNKPLSEEMQAKIRDEYADIGGSVYRGGPVRASQIASLVYDPENQERPEFLNPNSLEEPAERLEDYLCQVWRYPNYAFFLGYTGWGPLQLEMEILRGTWSSIDAEPSILFSDESRGSLWGDLQQKLQTYQYTQTKI